MNPNNSNSGGWKESYMRKTLLGNTGTPTSPPSNSLLAALPSALRNVMKPVTKYTDNVGNNTGNTQSNVTSTTDYLFYWLNMKCSVPEAMQIAMNKIIRCNMIITKLVTAK